MIKSLTITNHLGDSIKLELAKPEKSGFIVKSIDGLGPVKANINTYTAGSGDGSFYNSARLDSRSIVMSLKFLPIGNENVEDVRARSYKYFPIKKKIQIVVETDRRVLQTLGYVEANEPNIFSRDEGCSITINCPDPLFYSPATNETNFNGVEAEFEFPFSNESLTEPLIEFGTIVNRTEEVVYYEGDGEVGMIIEIHAVGKVGNITLLNVGTGEKLCIDTTKMRAFDAAIWNSECVTYNKNQDRYEHPYTRGDIVSHEGKIYVYCCDVNYTLNTQAGGYNDYSHFIPGKTNAYGYYWIELTDKYSSWDIKKAYNIGSVVMYNNRRWVLTGISAQTYTGLEPIDGNSTNNGEVYWFDITDYIITGDTITIDTRKGNKSVTLLRNGKYYNILNALDRNSKWLTLSHGDNVFSYEADVGTSNLQFKIYNNVVYDGV